MDAVLHECLYPVVLGSDTMCHALVRQFEKQYRIGSVVLTGGHALTLRFLPWIQLVHAPATLDDDILMAILEDVMTLNEWQVPMLVLSDEAYRGFVLRNRKALESRFILRTAKELLYPGGHFETF